MNPSETSSLLQRLGWPEAHLQQRGFLTWVAPGLSMEQGQTSEMKAEIKVTSSEIVCSLESTTLGENWGDASTHVLMKAVLDLNTDPTSVKSLDFLGEPKPASVSEVVDMFVLMRGRAGLDKPPQMKLLGQRALR